MAKKIFFYLIFLTTVSYLLFNTALVSDEFSWIVLTKGESFKDLLFPKEFFLIAPVLHYLLYIWYRFFDVYNLFLPTLLKVFYISLSFYLIAKFFSIYSDKRNAMLTSFLFIFFPSHDFTAFSLEGLYPTLTIAFYVYSFYLAYNNRLILSLFMALIASFTSYASFPIALSLFLLFALNKEFKKGALILVPNIIYSLYYIVMSRVMHIMKTQIPDSINLLAILKQFILQILTFADSILGPSMWLKIYYSFFQLSLESIIIGLCLITVLYRAYKGVKVGYDSKLIISLVALMFISFAIFAITGMYPQLAFNLGNRTTIFGSLLFAYLFVSLPVSRQAKILIFSMAILVILGISDHWKVWNVHQQKVISNIKNNENLKDYNDSRIIYVSGNQFSKYGPISHIEFFSESWVIISVFRLALQKDISFRTINKRHIYSNGYLIDTKYNSKDEVSGYINIYDSYKNLLFKLKPEEINGYIESLFSDNRHWIQLIDNKFLKNLVNKLMPRLKYAL